MAGCVAKRHALKLRQHSHMRWLSENISLQSFRLPLAVANIQTGILSTGQWRKAVVYALILATKARTLGTIHGTQKTGNLTHNYVEHRISGTLKQQQAIVQWATRHW
jgi:hypothetical protein